MERVSLVKRQRYTRDGVYVMDGHMVLYTMKTAQKAHELVRYLNR